MSIGQWSTTASNNATADPSINWQEGQAPSTVNDSARAMMAALAVWFQNPEWLNYTDTPTYVNATTFTVPTNRTSIYSPGRRIRATVTAGAIYGTIQSSVFGTLTTVVVAMDSGAFDSGLSEVDVGILQNQLAALMPAGTLIDFAGATPPSGFLNCDGSAVSRTTYAGLFSAIGTTWGSGDGSTTFNLPDMRRKASIGSGGTSISGPSATVGSSGGEETHTLSVGEMPSHNHTIYDPQHYHTVSSGGALVSLQNGGTQYNVISGSQNTQSASTGITINNAGGGGAHNNMQPSAVVTKCIKY